MSIQDLTFFYQMSLGTKTSLANLKGLNLVNLTFFKTATKLGKVPDVELLALTIDALFKGVHRNKSRGGQPFTPPKELQGGTKIRTVN